MNYDKLSYLLDQHTEIHYVSDCDVFFNDNNLNIQNYENYKFILFEYTSDMVELINSLKSNKIQYTKETDEWGLDYILIK